QAELDVLSAQLEKENPKFKGWRGVVVTPQENISSSVNTALPIFFAAAGFVLLIACANIANLLMARNNGRAKEMAIRQALGAGRFRLIRQLLSESLLLALAGGGLGVLLALWSIDLIRNMRPDTILQLDYLEFNREALIFNLALAALTSLLFGLGPALQASRIDLNQTLKQGAKSIFTFGRQRFVRGALVVCQVTLALVLLAGAGLLIRSFVELQNVERGFDSDNLLTMLIDLPESRYPNSASQERFFDDLLARIKEMPGVEGAAIASEVPPDTGLMMGQFEIEGRTLGDGERPEFFAGSYFGTDYFRLMGIPVLEGRAFTDQDDAQSPNVVIINEKVARRFWPDESAVGKHFRLDPKSEWTTVIGVVGDVKVGPLENDRFSLQTYYPFKRTPIPAVHIVVRSKLDPARLIPNLKASVWSLDRDLPVKGMETVEEKFAASLSRQRFNTLLLIVFACVAMLLSAVGIYGVMSYTVAQRTREIGIRMALGAQHTAVLKLIVKQGMTLALVGVAIGLLAAFALTRLMESLLFGVSATDPSTFAAIALLLIVVAMAACYVPARRATKVDPMVALRYE
ncbi:MAG: ADOP family duplicated permease, partial [Blastocatellia bacterium]|nr:ADOP family duplicated permease [Blastocatellia bacterium]